MEFIEPGSLLYLIVRDLVAIVPKYLILQLGYGIAKNRLPKMSKAVEKQNKRGLTGKKGDIARGGKQTPSWHKTKSIKRVIDHPITPSS